MIDAVLILFFAYSAFRIIQSSNRESKIFREFKQSPSFAWLSLLFPLGPIVYMTTAFRLGLIPAILLGAGCYAPSLVLARKQMNLFDRAGTSRVQTAQDTATKAFGTAMAGLLYIAILAVIGLAKHL